LDYLVLVIRERKGMANVDLYNTSYGHYALEVYGEIRQDTYGEDYGQTSWVTTAESDEIPKLISLAFNGSSPAYIR
jgi:hypothetical protein